MRFIPHPTRLLIKNKETRALQKIRMVEHESYLTDRTVKPLKVTPCRTSGCKCSTTACKNVRAKQECPADCKKSCKNQNFRQNRYCHFTIVDAGDMGKGVIAIRDIPEGSFICAYTGEIITQKVHEQRVKEYAEAGQEHDYMFQAGAYYIDPLKIGNVAKYVNHSCSPNMVAMRWKIDGMDRRFRAIGYFAEEFIKAGTPLTVNYQFDYDENRKPCLCRSKNCLGNMGKGPKKEKKTVVKMTLNKNKKERRIRKINRKGQFKKSPKNRTNFGRAPVRQPNNEETDENKIIVLENEPHEYPTQFENAKIPVCFDRVLPDNPAGVVEFQFSSL
ncbi:hypothetical protein GCK72_024837 [Caenorhabditis remanei]|uniref:SET domain-containing protein n=1 Tax=Caenorhabditis remanei TaxID=31234 RepID=A0A6A5G0B2_CAERE|nr:hypothetical protein GCK72_024837 [Caenorhabditis remanei]KAF1748370.1 hypothetical protein GCK72_024837 [Caenorhabditis remanei]